MYYHFHCLNCLFGAHFDFFTITSCILTIILCQETSLKDMSHDMTKPTKWVCTQRRLRSAWASTQSDQGLRCLHEETLGP